MAQPVIVTRCHYYQVSLLPGVIVTRCNCYPDMQFLEDALGYITGASSIDVRVDDAVLPEMNI